MRRKIIQFVVSLFTTTGINPSTAYDPWMTFRFVIIFTSFLTADLATTMASLTNIDNFYAFTTPTPYVTAATSILSGAYFMFHYRTIVGKIMHKMDEDFYTYPDENLLQITYPWYLRDANIAIFFKLIQYSFFLVLFMVTAPMAGEVIYYGRIRTFIYPCWTPWKLDSLRMDIFTLMVEFYQACCGIWLSYTLSAFLLVTVIDFTRQYHRLKAAVSSIEDRTSALQEEIGGAFDDALRQNIIHCILHHRVLHEHFQMFRVWFSIFFSIELAISVVTFALALYTLINAPSLGQLMNYFTVVFFIWINLLVRCLISEIFTDLNDSLAETIIWEAPWYKVNKMNRTLLVIFHLTACQPLRLYGLSIFEATRLTFTKLVRVTYSFFNVLNLSVKK